MTLNAHNGSYALSAGAAERSAVFREIRACMFEAAQPQVASPPEKPCAVREVWRSQTCARSRLSLLPFFGDAKKTRSPEEDEFLRSKNETFARRVRFNEVKTSPLQEGLFLCS